MENEFDNDISVLYKQAQKLGVPTKFVKIDTRIKDNKEIKTYSNLISALQSGILAGLSLEKLYSDFSLLPSDLAMIYYGEGLKTKSAKKLLKEINDFYELLEMSPIRDEVELGLLYEKFYNDINNIISTEQYELEDLTIIQKELGKYKPLKYSPINLNSIVIMADMTFRNRIPNVDDGYEIFDLSKTTLNLPYLKWNATLPNNKILYKLYSGKSLEDRPDYNLIVPDTPQKETPHLFNFSVWSDIEEVKSVRETKDITKESYLNGIYNLSQNLLRLKIPIKEGNEKDLIIERIETAFPLKFNKIVETTISGDFFVYGIDVNYDIFAHMVMNYELMNTYLFQKELSTPAALSKTLKLYYRSATELFESGLGSSVSFTIIPLRAKGGEVVTIDGQKMRLSPEYPYIKVNISSAESLETAERFMRILSRLLSFYKENEAEVKKMYKIFIPELEKLEGKQSVSKNIGKSYTNSKISRLQQFAPDLFVSGYARKCLCPVQPIIVPDDEIEAWKNKKITVDGKEVQRQIMKFPPEDPQWNFVCPEDMYPFPGVKYNTDLSNKDEYKGLPCCFKKDQLNSKDSNYNKIYVQGETTKTITKGEHIVKTDKIAKPNNFALLPPNITNLISQYSEESGDILRMGVPRSVNSLLHCVSISIGDEKYLKSKDREAYLRKIRNVIQRKTFPSLVKQEMYDFTDNKISTQLDDNDIFYDPDLFYRAVEESYGINLYVFAPSNDEEKRLKNKSESKGVMKLPRFKLVYAKSPRNTRPCVLIYRTLGSESDSLYYPQCELIVDKDVETNQITYMFDEDMNNLLFPAYETMNRNISWELVEGDNKIDLVGRENVFSRINYYDLFKTYSPSKQYIDAYGKMRGMVIKIGGEDVMLVLPPSQPENLPNTDKVVRANLNTVMEVLNNPIAVSLTNGKMDGLWFTVLDLIYGVYVPIIPTENTLNLPVGPANPLGNDQEDVVPQIIKMKRDLDFTMQILKWLFILDLQKASTSVDIFMNKYVVKGKEGSISSKNIYDFTNVGRTFPQVNSVEMGIKEMTKRVPSLFRRGKIYLYSNKYYDGIKYILSQWTKERIDRYTKVPTVIKRIYLSQSDFIQYSGVSLFLSERDLRTWLSTLYKFNYENIKIDKVLEISRALQTDPYLYQAPDKHIYYIQNVVSGDLGRALNIGIYWEDNRINPGYNADAFNGDRSEIPYVIYDISAAKHPVISENSAGDSLNFISILRYSDNNYAAMLRLY